MRATIPVAATLTALLGAAGIFASYPAKPAGADAGALAPVAWMTGDWETHDATPYVEEHWTRPAGGAMLGNSRAIKDGKMVEFEFLRIETRADGIFYMPQPSGKPPVDFKFTPTANNEAVFVNPGHADHLQKIIYRKNADGTLTARIEGESNGKSFTQEWQYFPQMSGALQGPDSAVGYSLLTVPWWVLAVLSVTLVLLVSYLRRQNPRRNT